MIISDEYIYIEPFLPNNKIGNITTNNIPQCIQKIKQEVDSFKQKIDTEQEYSSFNFNQSQINAIPPQDKAT